MTLNVILGIALIVSNAAWWIHVRHLSGVTSDLKDVAMDVQKASNTVKAAAQTIMKPQS